MVDVNEARQRIEEAKKQQRELQQQAQAEQQRIPETTQRQLRDGRGLESRRFQRQLQTARQQVAEKFERIKEFGEQIKTADLEVKQAEQIQAQNKRTTELINRILKGKGLPMGVDPAEAKRVKEVIDKSPELQSAIEKVSTAKILGEKLEGFKTLKEEQKYLESLPKESLQSLSRMGLIKLKEVEMPDVSRMDRSEKTKLQNLMSPVLVSTDQTGLKEKQGFVEDVKEKYAKAEEWTRAKITEPFIWKPLQKFGVNETTIGETTRETIMMPILTMEAIGQRKDLDKTAEFLFESEENIPGQVIEDFSSSYVKEIREKPVKFGATTTAFFVAPGVFSLAGKGLGAVGLGGVASVVGKVAPPVLATIYGGSVISRVASSEEPSKTAGRIAGGEITPMFLGGFLAAKTYPKIQDWWATRGRTEVKTEDLIRASILRGEQTFPTADPKTHLSKFQKQGFGYHATPDKFGKEIIVKPGSSELPGLYISSEVSPHFLKVDSGSYSLYGGSLFQPFGKPGVAKVYPSGFVYTPAVKTSGGKWVWTKPTKLGRADVPGIKTEIEAIIPPGTELIKTGGNLFFKYGGRKIPLDVFSAVPSGESSLISGNVFSSSSYGGVGSSSVLTPVSFLTGSFLSSFSKKDTSSYVSPSSTSIPKSPTKPSPTYSPSISYFKASSRLPPTSTTITPPSLTPPSFPPRKPPIRKSPPSIPSDPTRPPTSRRPPIKPPRRERLVNWIKQKAREEPELFEVFSKRFGKPKKVGKARTKQKAESLLKSYLGKTLAASGWIEKSGKKIKAKELDILKSPEFRLAKGKKADPFMLIQKSKFRLKKSDPQVREIQYFKKSKKNKKFDWFD